MQDLKSFLRDLHAGRQTRAETLIALHALAQKMAPDESTDIMSWPMWRTARHSPLRDLVIRCRARRLDLRLLASGEFAIGPVVTTDPWQVLG